MTRVLRHLVVGLAGVVLVLGATGALAGGTLRIGRDRDSTIFDPILISQDADRAVVANANATLVRIGRDGTTVEPDLAESWEISSDGLVYAFHLRPDLRFSDGSPIKSSDVRFSLERLRDTPEAVFGALYAPMKRIETPDDRTVVITLSRPTAPFIALVALFAAAILPEDYVRNRYDEFLKRPIGAGNFKIVVWQPGESVVLEKNPYAWEAPAKPKLDRVEWRYIPNNDTRILKLQAGEIDAMIDVPFDRIAALRQDPNLEVRLDPSTREDMLLINHSRPPLDDLRVRQAICNGIDLDAIVQAVTFGFGKPANSYIPAGGMFHNADQKPCAHDPEKARQLLAEAGVEDLTLRLLITLGDVPQERMSELIRDQFANIGIAIEIGKQEVGQAWETLIAGDFDLGINYWTNDIVDPDQKTSFALYGDEANLSYFTRYRNPELSALIDRGRTELDPAKRKEIYYGIQAIAKQDAPWVDLYYSPYRNASRTYVKGFVQNPLGRFMLEDTEIAK